LGASYHSVQAILIGASRDGFGDIDRQALTFFLRPSQASRFKQPAMLDLVNTNEIPDVFGRVSELLRCQGSLGPIG
jgi:hypothetical protein